MAFAREDVNFENIKREADVEMLVKDGVYQQYDCSFER